VYIKRKTVISSFKVLIVGPAPYQSPISRSDAPRWNLPRSNELELEHNTEMVFPIPDMEQVKRTIMEVLSKKNSRPDFIVIETRNIDNTRIITITGYKETKNKGEVRVIFSKSIVQNEKG
jgi:hypothetical protein